MLFPLTTAGTRPLPSLCRSALLATAIALLALITAAAAQAASTAAVPYGDGLLWRVERAGTAPSHVFGTLHSTDPRVTTLPKPVIDALARARSVALEIVQNKETPVHMARAMVLPQGRRLDTILGDELFAKLAAVAGRLGLPARALVRLKPWAASTVISIPAEERAGAAQGRQRLDAALQSRAQSRGIPVHGLETVAEQLAIFDGMSERDQVMFLEQAVKDNAKLTEFVRTIKQYYLARDLAGLFTWMERQTAGADERLMHIFKDRVINDRNRTMVRRMAARLDEGAAFVAVGAAHLPGVQGVLNLLAARGWRVTRVY